MLSDTLTTLLASSYAFSIKAANYHWNIEGADFPQFHEMLGDIYADIYDQVDRIAEYVRTLEQYTPAGLKAFAELSIIADQENPDVLSDAYNIFKNMLEDNQKFINLLNTTFDEATSEKQQGIANFMAERLDEHQKLQWKLRSILKAAPEEVND